MTKPAPPEILVLEDNDTDLFFLEDSLARVGAACEIRSFKDGLEARQYIDDVKKEALPSLILLDLNMPRVSGAGLLESIRANAALEAIPVIVWSSTRAPKEFEKLRGIEEFLLKPSDLKGWRLIATKLQQRLRRVPA